MEIKTAEERCGECFIEGTGEDRTCKLHERGGQAACIGMKLYQEGQRSVIEAVLPMLKTISGCAHYRSHGCGADIKANSIVSELNRILTELNQEREK